MGRRQGRWRDRRRLVQDHRLLRREGIERIGIVRLQVAVERLLRMLILVFCQELGQRQGDHRHLLRARLITHRHSL